MNTSGFLYGLILVFLVVLCVSYIVLNQTYVTVLYNQTIVGNVISNFPLANETQIYNAKVFNDYFWYSFPIIAIILISLYLIVKSGVGNKER